MSHTHMCHFTSILISVGFSAHWTLFCEYLFHEITTEYDKKKERIDRRKLCHCYWLTITRNSNIHFECMNTNCAVLGVTNSCVANFNRWTHEDSAWPATTTKGRRKWIFYLISFESTFSLLRMKSLFSNEKNNSKLIEIFCFVPNAAVIFPIAFCQIISTPLNDEWKGKKANSKKARWNIFQSISETGFIRLCHTPLQMWKSTKRSFPSVIEKFWFSFLFLLFWYRCYINFSD